jgi:hypothetical protein
MHTRHRRAPGQLRSRSRSTRRTPSRRARPSERPPHARGGVVQTIRDGSCPAVASVIGAWGERRWVLRGPPNRLGRALQTYSAASGHSGRCSPAGRPTSAAGNGWPRSTRRTRWCRARASWSVATLCRVLGRRVGLARHRGRDGLDPPGVGGQAAVPGPDVAAEPARVARIRGHSRAGMPARMHVIVRGCAPRGTACLTDSPGAPQVFAGLPVPQGVSEAGRPERGERTGECM